MAAINPDRAGGIVYLRQRIVCLVAAIAFLVAAAAPNALYLGLVGIVLAALAVPQWRGRAPVAWLGTALRFASRPRHSYRSDGLFPLVVPDGTLVPVEVSGARVGAIADAGGLAAVIEIGDPSALLVVGGVAVPTPVELAGSPTADEPAVVAQVVLVRRGQAQRLFVAVRVGGDGIGWTDVQLRQALSGAVRAVVRRLARVGVTGRALPTVDATQAIAWAVHGITDGRTGGGDGPATIDERWDHLRIDESLHVTVRLLLRIERLSTDLLARVVGGPSMVSALSIADDCVLIRLAAATPAALATAVASVMAACPDVVEPMDGLQRLALAATLPLGRVEKVSPGRRGEPRRTRRARSDDSFTSPTKPLPIYTDARVTRSLGGPSATLRIPDAGLLLGLDRRGAPVFLQLNSDRTTPVRLAIVGGPAAARVLSRRLRALTEAPGGESVAPVAFAVFEHLTPTDGATLASADVVVCQPVSQPEAALVASALRLTRAGSWLSRIEGDMIAVISHGAVRWAQLSANIDEAHRVSGLSGLAGVARA
jgi:hypothetical protein